MVRNLREVNCKYNYPELTEDGKVVCQICGDSYYSITPQHLRKSHGMGIEEYRKEFPEAPLMSTLVTKKPKNIESEVDDKIFVRGPSDQDVKKEAISKIRELISRGTISKEELIKELDITVLSTSSTNGYIATKDMVFKFLKEWFPQIKRDLMIRNFQNGTKLLKYEFMTTFADPVEKLVIDFPNSMWANNEVCINQVRRDSLLESDGWRIARVDVQHPTQEDIDLVISKTWPWRKKKGL